MTIIIHAGFLAYEMGASRAKNALSSGVKNIFAFVIPAFYFFGWWVYWGFPTGLTLSEGANGISGAAYANAIAWPWGESAAYMGPNTEGPVSVDLLAQEIPAIRDLAYFGLMQTRLYGRDVMISRTGYTGERGYEIFCRAKDATHLWDSILDAGKDMGVRPVQFSTLDMLRIESYLLFYPGENSETFPFDDEPCGDTLWELGLDFTVSPDRTGTDEISAYHFHQSWHGLRRQTARARACAILRRAKL